MSVAGLTGISAAPVIYRSEAEAARTASSNQSMNAARAATASDAAEHTETSNLTQQAGKKQLTELERNYARLRHEYALGGQQKGEVIGGSAGPAAAAAAGASGYSGTTGASGSGGSGGATGTTTSARAVNVVA